MTIDEVIAGFCDNPPENAERDKYAQELFQEAIKIGMELNNQYHTPEEIREIMGRLTGRKIFLYNSDLFPCFCNDSLR